MTLAIDAALVRRLLAGQFPGWAGLPVAAVASAGTDNALFRVGEAMCARLPRVDWAPPQVEKEQRWLPRLAPHLPLAIPTPLAQGGPAAGYPWPWSVYDWLPGAPPEPAWLAGSVDAAEALAGFLAALQRIDAVGGPRPGAHNFGRGVRLAHRDGATRAALAELAGEIDVAAGLAAWDAALAAPPWRGPGRWLHGDLHPGNLLAANGRLTAVIDFGGLAVGDPACDGLAAWTCFAGEARRAFQAGLDLDDAGWTRARAWTVSVGATALASYRATNRPLASAARRWLLAALT
jgi:aminoglycoside phosphotransferase (APT) family kinase protein